MESCQICIEPFNKTPNRKKAACPYCDVKACVKCTQTYLINTHEDPHCMNCRKGWSREVMDEILLITWRNGEYKQHRQDILLDREKSRLPAAQLVLERQKLAVERQPLLQELANEMSKQLNLYMIAKNNYDHECSINIRLANGIDVSIATDKKQDIRVFVMPCPGEECRGFLSTAYKCGLCDKYTCPDCREIKGDQRDTQHTCNPDSVANVAIMKKECRNCPECGTSIFRIEGCSQMFCTQCKTAFDWNSGKKITTGAIHNPHYFEYLRAAGGNVPRTAGDIPCAGQMPNAGDLYPINKNCGISKDKMDYIYESLMTINHIRHVEIANQTNGIQDSDNTTINIRYLKNQIDEKRWKQLLQMREKRRMRRDEIRQRYEALCGAAADIMSRLPNWRAINAMKWTEKDKEDIRKIIDDMRPMLENLRLIYNAGMEEISKRYNTKVLLINPKFKRMQSKTIKKKIKVVSKVASKVVSKAESPTDSDADIDSDIEV